MDEQKEDPMSWGSQKRSRCPACKQFATEGKKHDCPKGRNRDPFVNPVTDPNTQGNP